MVDDVEAHAAELAGKGLERIDLGPNAGAAFFYPRSTMGILTELVDSGTSAYLHGQADAAARAHLHDRAEHIRHGHVHPPGTPPHSHPRG